MSEQIEHQGVVTEIGATGVVVKIMQTAACSACGARSSCMASESSEKFIEAQPLTEMQIGDEVQVRVARKLGFKAVLLAFVLPFLLLFGTVALLSLLTELNDGLIGTIALCTLLPYYLLVRLFRGKIEKQFVFYSEKK